ncbi:MAG: hypothetical protein CHACPFDD_02537 [Phycisphaerae bacterium]|nr:hypothetical protein [Phycisphaerae bacterium]
MPLRAIPRDVRSTCRALTALLPLALVSGCSSGVRWRYDFFDRVHAESRAAGRLTLVYFRTWYSVECTRVEDNVFASEQAGAATSKLNCVILNYDVDRSLATAWNIETIPAFVIVDEQSRVLSRQQGEFSLEQLLAAIRQAEAGTAGATSRAP